MRKQDLDIYNHYLNLKSQGNLLSIREEDLERLADTCNLRLVEGKINYNRDFCVRDFISRTILNLKYESKKYKGNHLFFENFIERETHYALERVGWKWDGRFRKKEILTLTDDLYNAMRNRVLDAFVDCALKYEKEKTIKNLTRSLKPLIK